MYNKAMKKLLKVVGIFILLGALCVSLYYYATNVSIATLSIVNQNIESTKLNEDNSNLKIAFISDLHYNNFMNKQRLEQMIDKINQNKPDILLFAGDVFDEPSKYPISEETKQELIDLLKGLKADLGKFAVLGEQDHDHAIADSIEDILFQADFECLNNEHILITKNNSSAINLIGIDSLIGGTPDITASFENIDSNAFTIVLTHAPDIMDDLPQSGIDLVLSGHSHGGQVALPFFGPLTEKKGALSYSHGSYYVNQTKLIVSNGLGTTESDIRLFAEPQCHMIRLTKQ